MLDFTEIIPGLWMGGSYSPAMPTGFDGVVCCREVSDWALIGVPFLHLPMIDGPALPDMFLIWAGKEFVDRAIRCSKKVLVHCAEGHNRSGLVVATYLIGYGPHVLYGEPEACIDLIRSKRPGALSNQVFVDYLLTL